MFFAGKSSAAVVESLTLCKLYELNILFLKKGSIFILTHHIIMERFSNKTLAIESEYQRVLEK